jgi:hypothetical protein
MAGQNPVGFASSISKHLGLLAPLSRRGDFFDMLPCAWVGANVLFGGSGRSFALQPLSLQGQVGLDLTLGVSGLEVRWLPP